MNGGAESSTRLDWNVTTKLEHRSAFQWRPEMSNKVLITGTELMAGEGTPGRQRTDVTNDSVTLEQIAKLWSGR